MIRRALTAVLTLLLAAAGVAVGHPAAADTAAGHDYRGHYAAYTRRSATPTHGRAPSTSPPSGDLSRPAG